MPRLNTEDFSLFDLCPRRRLYELTYAPYRVPVSKAMADALHAGLSAADAGIAAEKLMSTAANPGLELPPENLYSACFHHSKLIEVITQYVLELEPLLSLPGPIRLPWGEFQPLSFLTNSGDLLRVVICDRWDEQREQMERFSWRTAIDTAITGRPMTIIAIVIGRAEKGFRSSPWTIGYRHPSNKTIRIKKKGAEEFGSRWDRVYREQTDEKPLDWLTTMQEDGAFENHAFMFTEPPPVNAAEVLRQIDKMAADIGAGVHNQTRSACFKLRPCPFTPACLTAQSPAQLGWREHPQSPLDHKLDPLLSCS